MTKAKQQEITQEEIDALEARMDDIQEEVRTVIQTEADGPVEVIAYAVSEEHKAALRVQAQITGIPYNE